jgi:DNA-binding NarL/FixJ family response regulator
MVIRLVLADDHPIVLSGLVWLFSQERDIEVVAAASTGNEALKATRQFAPDILVLDLRMPGKNGVEVLDEMKRDALSTRVVVLTAIENEEVLAAIRLGARGVVLKDMAVRLLVECVRMVHSGGTWIEKSVAARALNRMVQHESGAGEMARNLTRREIEVARMIADGLPNKRVADRLAITEGTAKLHLHNIYSKLNLSGRVGLVRYMQRHGFD